MGITQVKTEGERKTDEENLILKSMEDEELDNIEENRVEYAEEEEEEVDDDEEFDDYESMLESMRNVLGKTSGKQFAFF